MKYTKYIAGGIPALFAAFLIITSGLKLAEGKLWWAVAYLPLIGYAIAMIISERKNAAKDD
jgi:type IV secretory pathway VirB2 component (pilin)